MCFYFQKGLILKTFAFVYNLFVFLIYFLDFSYPRITTCIPTTHDISLHSKSLNYLEITVNNELVKVCDWLLANKLTLNIKKSNYVIFHPHQKKVAFNCNLKIFDHERSVFKHLVIERKNFVKYLGVLIYNNLSWKSHADYVTLKISKIVGIIPRLRHFLSSNIRLDICRSLINPTGSSLMASQHGSKSPNKQKEKLYV